MAATIASTVSAGTSMAGAQTEGASSTFTGSDSGGSFTLTSKPRLGMPSLPKPRYTGYTAAGHKATKKGAVHGPRQPQMKPLPPLKKPGKLVAADLRQCTLAGELRTLAALEELKRQNPDLRVTYATYRAPVRELLGKAWFLDRVLDCNDPELAGRDDEALWVTAPDHRLAVMAENAVFEQIYNRRMAEYSRRMEQYAAAGIQHPNLEAPVSEFQATWHQSQAAVYDLARGLGVQFQLPGAPLPPYAVLSTSQRRQYERVLEKAGVTREIFGVYDFSKEPEEMQAQLAAAMREAMPGAKLYSFPELLDLAVLHFRSDPDPLRHALGLAAAALGHGYCALAAGSTGDFVELAWGAGCAAVLSLYDGEAPEWDGVLSPFPFLLDRRNYPAEELLDPFRKAIVSLLSRVVNGV